jgi:hypothetical protein
VVLVHGQVTYSASAARGGTGKTQLVAEYAAALRVSGTPGGTIYLSGGRQAFAGLADAPDLGSRLVESGRLPADQWSRAGQDSRPDGCAGDLLLGRGLIHPDEWEMLLRSAGLDALLALVVLLAAEYEAVIGELGWLKAGVLAAAGPLGPVTVEALPARSGLRLRGAA